MTCIGRFEEVGDRYDATYHVVERSPSCFGTGIASLIITLNYTLDFWSCSLSANVISVVFVLQRILRRDDGWKGFLKTS